MKLNSKPSWEDAPEWAQFLAQDGKALSNKHNSGEWFWFECKPYLSSFASELWELTEGECKFIGHTEDYSNWQNSLEQRPSKSPKFNLGDYVTKTKGSAWQGRVVGTYSTKLTPEGYAVESSAHPGSVQIYPAAALELYE